MLSVIDPAHGRVIAELPEDTAQSVADKARSARAEQVAWAAAPFSTRLIAIQRFREELVRESDRLAAVLTAEVGKPIKQSRNELAGVLGRIDFFLESTEKALAPSTVFNEVSMREVITHEPLGVVGNISAWNYPYFVGANVFVPALLAGNAVLYKPSEFATLTGLEIGKLMHLSGVPQCIFQVLVGAGSIGAALLEQPIDGVFFTGSYTTGRRIAETLAPRMVRLQLELGGKDPAYVCDDVSVPTAAASLADGAMYNTGQSCCSVERIYVQDRVHDSFVESFVNEVKSFRIGDPSVEASYIGPLTRAAQLDVVERQIADAIGKGATIVTGGRRLPGPGNWFEPTVVVDVDHTMELMREESFGPVIGIQRVTDDSEAIRLMNDTVYGLTAGVYTQSTERAKAILAQVHSGTVYWNCCDRVSPRLPWSGVGHSGVGVTLSTYGIEAFTRLKAWHLKSVS